jgi:hypothetical protein
MGMTPRQLFESRLSRYNEASAKAESLTGLDKKRALLEVEERILDLKQAAAAVDREAEQKRRNDLLLQNARNLEARGGRLPARWQAALDAARGLEGGKAALGIIDDQEKAARKAVTDSEIHLRIIKDKVEKLLVMK